MAAAIGRFFPGHIVSRTNAGGGLTRMTIATTVEATASYTSPGQYVEVRTYRQTGYFVLACLPGATTWELVMRSGGGASDVLLRAPDGAPLEVTHAIGIGFPMSDTRGHPLIVVLSGSGIAAGPPVVARRISDHDEAMTNVLVGIRSPGELSMREDLQAWMRAGVDVRVCVSSGEGPINGIPFTYGRIQDVLRAGASARQGLDYRIFAVGAPSLFEGLRTHASELGVTSEHIHQNI